MAFIRAAWPKQEVLPETAEVYAAELAHVPFGEAKDAVRVLMRSSKWFPTIAEILERVAERRHPMVRPELAWGEVQDAISRVGMYLVPVFRNQAIQRAVNAIGWRDICTDDNLAATRARFLEAYRSAREEVLSAEATGLPLPSPYHLRQLPASSSAVALEHGAPVFVGKPFKVPLLGEGDAPGEAIVQSLALVLTRRDTDKGEAA